jgi:hypothetical protein
MQQDDRLQQFLSRNYEVRVRHDGSKYDLFIAELNLRERHSDLAQAYANLQKRREDWIRELAAEDLWSWIVEPGSVGSGGPAQTQGSSAPIRVEAGGGLKLFFIKGAIVTTLLLVVLAFLARGLTEAGYRAEKGLDGIVNWPEEKVLRYSKHARDIVAKLRPIANEVRVLFERDPVDPAPQKP